MISQEMIHGRIASPGGGLRHRLRSARSWPKTQALASTGTVPAPQGQGEWERLRQDAAAYESSLKTARGRKYRRPRMSPGLESGARAIAGQVRAEACEWLGEFFPEAWAEELVEHTQGLYAHNPRIQQRLRKGGPAAFAWLRAFMRHWLRALLSSRRPDLAARLPSDFAVGRAPRL